MKKIFRKMVVLMLFLSCIGLIGGASNIYAKSGINNKNIVLSDKYTGKKLDRIKNSIKGKKEYRFLIESSDSFDSISSYFKTGDKKAKVKIVANNTYMVRLPLNTNFLNEELTQINNGVLPLNIGGYDVIQPEIVELSGTGILAGEQTDKLWGQTKIGADIFQEELQSKNKIKVAILDTGIDYNHSDLDNNYDTTLSYDFINDDTDALDDNGHGTGIAGIIGSEVNGAGTYGVNSNTDLVALKVLDVNGLGTTYDILEAIDYAKTNNIKVINMSFGGMGDASTSAVCQAITDAKANGIYTVVSAGNNNTDITNLVPASCADSITVGAIDSQNNKASFSNYGTGVMLYAPGVDIYSTSLNNTYATVNGTSFSAPFVTGLVAKELAFSGGVSYSGVVSNVVNNYGLYYNFIFSGNTNTQNNSNQQQILTGTGWTNTENIFDRFSDFEYLFHTKSYVYYKDKLNGGFIYRLVNDNSKFGFGIDYLLDNINSIYSNKDIYTSDYFNSGIYIDYLQFINERNEYYKIIGLDNKSLDNLQFSTQSIGLGKYYINHQFSSISGIKLNNSQSTITGISNITNEVIYTNQTNNATLFKKSLNNYGDGIQLTTDQVGYWDNGVKLSPAGDYVVYNNVTDGYTLYKKNLNSSGNGTKITTNKGFFLDISNDGTFITYTNISNYNLYKKNANDTADGDAIINTGGFYPVITPDQNYIIYVGDGKLYKKSIGVVGNGNAFTSDSANIPQISNDGSFVVYQNTSDGYKLYKKGINEYGNGQAITASFTNFFDISKDGSYIIYENSLDNFKLYKKYIWESGVGVRITDKSVYRIKISNNTNEAVYSNVNDKYSIYKINLANPKGFAMDDGIYKSPEILPGKNLGYLKIDVNSSIPYGTDYNFYLANQKTEETLFEANEGGVDMMGSDIYLFGDNYINGTKQSILSKVNVGDTIYLDKNGNIGEFKVQYKDDWSIRLEYSSDLWNYRGAKIYIGGSNFVKLNKSDLTGTTNINLNNLFGLTTDKLYYKIELLGNTSDTTKTPIINSVELVEGKLDAPTNLKQEIQSPQLEKQPVNQGEKIGKFQSGSGMILSAFVGSTTQKQLRLAVDIYKLGTTTPIDTKYSIGTTSSGTLQVIIPYLGAGDYYWKARTVDDSLNTSDPVDYGANNIWDVDYGLYEGFEPYPFGYSFVNSHPALGVLDGGIINIYDQYDGTNPYILDLIDKVFISSGSINPYDPTIRFKYSGNKWDMFNFVFPESIFNNNDEMFDAFESLGLNKLKPEVFQGGNCLGLAISALSYYDNGNFVKDLLPDFYNLIGSRSIRESLNMKKDDYGLWNNDDVLFRSVLELQLMQKKSSYKSAENKSASLYKKPIDVLNELKSHPNIPYILLFAGRVDEKSPQQSHAVVPYRVDGNKIYIWDNNVPFPKYDNFKAYEQYIEVVNDGKGWKSEFYNKKSGWNLFEDIELVNIYDVIGIVNDLPIGFNDNDTVYSLSGDGDLIVTDSQGRISGFSGGTILEDIPGVNVITPMNVTLSGTTENTWKQIYLPQKLTDLTVKVISKSTESYDLMVAGGDYYTKLEGVESNTGEIDTYIPTREKLNIDFDDSKIGDYNLLVDDFQNDGTGTVYIDNIQSTPNQQQYSISWTGVLDNANDAVIKEIDTNNDGIYNGTGDTVITLPPIFQDQIAPTTSNTFSGILTSGYSTGSYIETVNINLNALDNENGSGIDKTFYAIGTNTGTLEYITYSGSIIVNGVGDYTLNYYSVDKFGNVETVKTINFTLTEKPETYAGIISGNVYEDINNDGLKDIGENMMAGWKICIDKNNDGICQENIEPFILTNNDGYYEFNGLAKGIYKIIEIPHQNWNNVTPIEGYYNINLGNGQIVINKNFGNIRIKGGKK